MSSKWILRYSNNVYGEEMKYCYAGSYNVTLIDDKPYINIYLQDKLILSIEAFKNPYHLAKAILGVSNPQSMVDKVNHLVELGYKPGVDFTISDKGVNLRKL